MGKSYKKLLRDPRWQKKRLKVLERAGWKCERCGNGEEELHVHHTFYDGRKPWKYPKTSLECLCKACHNAEHDESTSKVHDAEHDESTYAFNSKEAILDTILENNPDFMSGSPSREGLSAFLDEIIEVPWTLYYENGNKKKQGVKRNGKPHGLMTHWYSGGKKRWERSYKDGVYDGIHTEWRFDGLKTKQKVYEDGKLMSAVVWKPNGDKCPVTNLKDGNGILVEYNRNGTEKSHSKYKEGRHVKTEEFSCTFCNSAGNRRDYLRYNELAEKCPNCGGDMRKR
jgi:hypothetical protein